MSRWSAAVLVCFMSAGLHAQAQKKPQPQEQEKEQAPPEEDDALKPKVYALIRCRRRRKCASAITISTKEATRPLWIASAKPPSGIPISPKLTCDWVKRKRNRKTGRRRAKLMRNSCNLPKTTSAAPTSGKRWKSFRKENARRYGARSRLFSCRPTTVNILRNPRSQFGNRSMYWISRRMLEGTVQASRRTGIRNTSSSGTRRAQSSA